MSNCMLSSILCYKISCCLLATYSTVWSGGLVQLRLLGYLIFCLKIDLRNTNLLRKNPINNNDQHHKNLAHSVIFTKQNMNQLKKFSCQQFLHVGKVENLCFMTYPTIVYNRLHKKLYDFIFLLTIIITF